MAAFCTLQGFSSSMVQTKSVIHDLLMHWQIYGEAQLQKTDYLLLPSLEL